MSGILKNFARDLRGNIAILSSLLAVPLLLSVGYALDYSTISHTRSALQQGLDAAVMAVAREGKSISDEDAYAIAKEFLAENFVGKFSKLKVEKNGTAFTVRAEARADMAFGGLFGYPDWAVGAASTADLAYASYEIALVLDTTGSMAGGKLVAMKDAVLGLLETMPAQVNDTDKLKFAMVPFATFVNVGPNYGPSFDKDGKQVAGSGASWLDLTGKSPVPQSELGAGASRFQIYHNLGLSWPGCVETRYTATKDYDIDDTPANAANAETLFVPAFGIDEPDDQGYANDYIESDAKPRVKTVSEKRKRWAKYGVATDNAGNPLLGGLLAILTNLLTNSGPGNNNGKKATIAIDSSASLVTGKPMGPGHGCEVQPLTPLTSDYKGLEAKVKGLEANGTTNIMEGVAWGHRVLSPGAPFAEGKVDKAGVEKIMVVLTDGTNVFGNSGNELGSNYSSFGYLVDGRLGVEGGGASTTTDLMNKRTLAACTAAKAAGVEVYTIRLEEPNVATGTMLSECASDADHYFDVPTRTKLDEVFAKIKERIVRIRLSS